MVHKQLKQGGKGKCGEEVEKEPRGNIMFRHGLPVGQYLPSCFYFRVKNDDDINAENDGNQPIKEIQGIMS